MNIFLNLLLFIGALQGIDSKHPWYERLVGGATHFLGFHLVTTYLVSRQVRPDNVDNFFINIYSYVKLFSGPMQVLPFVIGFAIVYCVIVLVRKVRS